MFINPPHSKFHIPVVRTGGSICCKQTGSFEATTLFSLELIVQCNIKHNKIKAEQYTGPKRTNKYMGNTISSCFGSFIICTGDDSEILITLKFWLDNFSKHFSICTQGKTHLLII
jgi:hypothetical protein